jgi:hypothetical protein
MSIKPGAIRFNTDSMKLEIFRGSANYNGSASMAGIGTLAAGQWEEIEATSPDVLTGGTRGLNFGGYNPSNTYLDDILYINLATTGNTQYFGELIVTDRTHVNVATSDKTRGISAGGYGVGTPTGYAHIEYVTIASTGDAIDFGVDLSTTRGGAGGASNGTRGIFFGGYNPGQTDTIEYITIQSKGVAVQDFGNLTNSRSNMGAMCSSTRGIFSGGRAHPAYYNLIEYVTMSTLGNAADFGDLIAVKSAPANGITSNSVRGIIMGGYSHPAYVNTIEYVTIPTLGNTQDFGNLSTTRGNAAGCASPTRCMMFGGAEPTPVVAVNTMEYVQIPTTGNAIDFGDMHVQATGWAAAASNGHGGL